MSNEAARLPIASELNCEAFRRVTGRAKPSLSHPTARKFDANAWRALLREQGDLGERDKQVAIAALFLHREIASLRSHVIDTMLAGLSTRTVVRLAIANANRTYSLIRNRMHGAWRAAAKAREGQPWAALAHTTIAGSELQPEIDASDLNTAAVDSLPHWFAQAKELGEAEDQGTPSFLRIAARSGAALSIERGLRDFWQSVLWEGWILAPDREGGGILAPRHPDVDVLWAAWAWRQEAIVSQSPLLDLLIGPEAGQSPRPDVLSRVVANVVKQGRSARVKLREPTKAERKSHQFEVAIVEASYAGLFLDHPLRPDTVVTYRELLSASILVSDIGMAMLNEVRRPELHDYAAVRRLCLALPCATLIRAFVEAMGVSHSSAEELLRQLTVDPLDLPTAFSQALWRAPLVAVPGREEVMIVAGAARASNPVRRVDLWLQKNKAFESIGGSDMGLLFEEETRSRVIEALSKNETLTDASAAPDAIKKQGGGGEEIDLLVRIGKTVLVGEVKCLLYPTEASERYDHCVKIEQAAAQASRKAVWLSENPDRLTESIGALPCPAGELRYQPMVVLNHGAGLSLERDGVLVTDRHFLTLFLETNTYVSNAAVRYGDKRAGTITKRLYGSAAEAEDRLRETFANPPGLQPFKAAARWRTIKFPTSSGSWLQVSAPYLDADAMRPPEVERLGRALLAGT